MENKRKTQNILSGKTTGADCVLICLSADRAENFLSDSYKYAKIILTVLHNIDIIDISKTITEQPTAGAFFDIRLISSYRQTYIER